MSVPIHASPGRNGFDPQLSPSYESGSGNSAFGCGGRRERQDGADDGAPLPYSGAPGFAIDAAWEFPKTGWLQAALLPPGALLSVYQKKDPAASDEGKARPLKSGVKIVAENRSAAGTLGFLIHAGTSPDRVFAVTNWHVVAASRLTNDIIGKRVVSQPDKSCLGCTTNYFGTVVAGARTDVVDIALIELKPGTKYTADIRGLGGKDASGNDIDAPVRGFHALTHQEITAQTIQVKKRGFVTGLTGGKIVPDPSSPDGTVLSEVDVMLMNQLKGLYQVSANPDPKSPSAGTIFSTSGDSGSAVVTDTDPSDPNFNFLLGLHVAGNPAPPNSDLETPRAPYSMFIPIQAILDFLHNDPGIAQNLGMSAAQQQNLSVLTAPAPDQVHMVAVNEMAVNQTAMIEAEVNADPLRAKERLRALPEGRRYLELFERHQNELVRLIRGHRRIATAWQRTGIAEVAESLRQAVQYPGSRMPERVAGRTLQQAIDDFVAVLRRYCSTALSSDVESVQRTLPIMTGLTLPEILDRLGAKSAEAAE